MQKLEKELFDDSRNRKIPIILYKPDKPRQNDNIVIFSHGYRTQKDLKDRGPSYTNYSFLAEHFNNNGFFFLSIQHDLIGDKDGLETINPNENQSIARQHLWSRGAQNIEYCLKFLAKNYSNINTKKFIISGHSNGGDIAKYYANLNEDKVEFIISLDGRRAPIKPGSSFRILMFEASDTALDPDVIPGGLNPQPGDKQYLEYMLVKPKESLHGELNDNGTKEIKTKICKTIDFFVNDFTRT